MRYHVPYDLKSAYEQVIESLEDAAVNANCGFVFKAPIKFELVDEGVFKCEFFVHLFEWKARNDQINVLMRVRECIASEESQWILKKSSVEVSYFKAKKPARFMHGMHFDYSYDYASVASQFAHPVFHAQLTDKPLEVPAELNADLEFNSIDTSGAMPQPFCYARIPTSDMTMCSALLSIAADHIHTEFFCQFLEKVIRYQSRLPKPTFWKTRESITISPEHFRSCHWYAHMADYDRFVREAKG